MKSIQPGFNEVYAEEAPTLDQVKVLPGDVLLEFGAPWCEHCLRAEPIVQEVLNERPLVHLKIYDGKGKRLGRAFRVKLWPTLIYLRDGEELARLARPKNIDDVRGLLSYGG